MKTSMRENKPRTDAGRNVDTWKFTLPAGGTVDFKVTLHTDHQEAWFAAKTDHVDFRGVKMTCPDINRLKAELTESVEARLDVLMAAEWTPSKMFEMSYSDRTNFHNYGIRGSAGLTINFAVAEVSANTAQPVGNRGQTMITAGNGPVTAVQRSHDDVFVKPTSLKDADGIDMREYSTKVSRTIVADTDEHDARCRALLACLTAFAQALGDRMSPSVVGTEGLPLPEDLVRMMAEAAATPDETPRAMP